MHRRGKLCLGVAAAAGAGVLVFGQAAIAQPPAEQETVYADVDGDGSTEPVTVRKGDDATQVISFALPQGTVETTAPANYSVLRTPRVTDVNRDGAAEVAVIVTAGANTDHFQLFKYDPAAGVVAVESGAEPFTFYEGGGASARLGYQCEDPGKGPMLRTVRAQYDSSTAKFDGTTSWFIFTGNSASEWTKAPFQDLPADDPALNLDPGTCAP